MLPKTPEEKEEQDHLETYKVRCLLFMVQHNSAKISTQYRDCIQRLYYETHSRRTTQRISHLAHCFISTPPQIFKPLPSITHKLTTTFSSTPLISVLGQLCVADTNEDQHLDPGDVAIARHQYDSSGFAGIRGLGLARGKGADTVPGDVGGGRRWINGQSAH